MSQIKIKPDSQKEYVFYEVNLKIQASIIFEFDEWLKQQIQKMLELPGFVSASVNIPEKTMTVYQYRSVKYRLDSKQALDNYFEKYAEQMRSDALARFAGKFTATRKVYLFDPNEAVQAQLEQSAKKPMVY